MSGSLSDLTAAMLDLGASWFAIVVPASIRVALIVLLTWGVASSLRSRGASLRSLVWTTGLTSALMMPLLAPTLASGPSFTFETPDTQLIESSEPHRVPDGGAFADIGDETPSRSAPVSWAEPPGGVSGGDIVQTEDSAWSPGGIAGPQFELSLEGGAGWSSLFAGLGLLSLTGSLLLGARLVAGHLGGWLRTRRLPPIEAGPWAVSIAAMRLTEGVPHRVRFVLAPGAASPQTWGLIRPTVVLSSDGAALTEAERRAVLRHELAHVSRFDTLWLIAERALVALFWWNSLVWPAQRRAQLEREQACDDAVLGGGATPSRYAGQLLRQAQDLREMASATGMSMLPEAEGQLTRRVGSILDPEVRRGAPRRALVAVVVGAMFVAACSVSSVGVGADHSRAEWSDGDGVLVEERADRTLVTIDEGLGEFAASVPTGIRFASDTEIATIDGATLAIEDTRARPTRTLEVESVRGELEFLYRVDGDEHELDGLGREWLHSTLLELFRRAGIDHEARVGRLHASGGTEAVLAETALLGSDFVAASYLGDLLRLPDLADGAEVKVIEVLPRLVHGTFLRARVIERLDLELVLEDAALRDALVGTLRSLEESPFELGRTLEGTLAGLAVDEEAFAAVLGVGVHVRSDFERGQLLEVAAFQITDTGVALDAWLAVAGRMESSFELGRALERLLDRSAASGALRLEVIGLVGELNGDFERSRVLMGVASRFSGSDEERDAYRAAARSIRSDFERGRALAALDDFVSRG